MKNLEHAQVNLWKQTHTALKSRVAKLNDERHHSQQKWSLAAYIDKLVRESK